MSDSRETRSVVMERFFAHPPAKLWRALTESRLMGEWLLKNDFAPEIGHRFQFSSEPMRQWDGLIDCEVLVVEPLRQVSYRWKALGLDSVVVWTLTATEGGTLVRMEHSGFLPGQAAAYRGATYGWERFMGKLENLIRRMD